MFSVEVTTRSETSGPSRTNSVHQLWRHRLHEPFPPSRDRGTSARLGFVCSSRCRAEPRSTKRRPTGATFRARRTAGEHPEFTSTRPHCHRLGVRLGCADRGNDSSLAAPVGLSVERGSPPTCFSDPLAECLHTKEPIDNAKRFASHWLYPFHADLHHRVCRGDAPARERFLDGVRTLQPREGPDRVRAVYLDFLAGCSAEGFCEWAAAVATDAEEGRETRLLLLEAVRRGCVEE